MPPLKLFSFCAFCRRAKWLSYSEQMGWLVGAVGIEPTYLAPFPRFIDCLDSNQRVGICYWNHSHLRTLRLVECLGSCQEVVVRVGLPSVPRDLSLLPHSFSGRLAGVR